MILQFALILSFLTAGPAAVLACVNAMRVDGDDAVKQIAQAERLLARGELAKAGRLVDIHDYRFVDSGLQARAALVFHTVALRERGTEKYRLTRAGEFIAEALEKKSDDPVLVSRHAEVLALTEKTSAQARAAIEDLMSRDLVPEAQSYVTLARLLANAGEKAASDDALTDCLNMTKFKAVCSLKKSKVRKHTPRNRSRSRSRSKSRSRS